MLRKKDKQYYNEEAYIKFLENLLVDKNLKEEIIEQINIFKDDGKISFDGNNLYGKIINKSGNDYLEIRYENDCFVCNYTKWNGRNNVNISQIDLKNNNTKVNRKEKTEFKCPDDKNNTSIEEIEKIYNKNSKLIYEATLKKDTSYDSLEGHIVYESGSPFSNNFELSKNWYVSSGSIINYRLRKKYFYEQGALEESYSICEGPYHDEYQTIYCFDELNQKLFKDFMTGKISIQEVIVQNKEINEQKKLCK